MTCSLGTVEAEAGIDTAATAVFFGRTRQRKKRDTASIHIDHPRSRLINVCTDKFLLSCSEGTPTLSWRFPQRQARQGLARIIYQDSCGWDGSWQNSQCRCYAYRDPRGSQRFGPWRVSPIQRWGDATDLSSAYYRSTGVPSNPIAEPEPLCTVHHPISLAPGNSGRGPSRDRSGGTPDGRP